MVWLHLGAGAEARRNATITTDAPNAKAPAAAVRWGWLYATALIAALSHLLLDWTNNYGVRPFFPFNPRWYAGSFVFIAEPVLWALLLLALVVPWLLGLADREIGARRKAFRGRGWAIFALTGMVVSVGLALGGACAGPGDDRECPGYHGPGEAHGRRALSHQSLPLARHSGDARIFTRPPKSTPAPARSTAIRSGTCSTSRPTRQPPRPPNGRPWGRSIWTGERGRWCAMWARTRCSGWIRRNLPPNRTWTTVEFTDLRFDYSFLGTGGATEPPRWAAGFTSWTATTTRAKRWAGGEQRMRLGNLPQSVRAKKILAA